MCVREEGGRSRCGRQAVAAERARRVTALEARADIADRQRALVAEVRGRASIAPDAATPASARRVKVTAPAAPRSPLTPVAVRMVGASVSDATL